MFKKFSLIFDIWNNIEQYNNLVAVMKEVESIEIQQLTNLSEWELLKLINDLKEVIQFASKAPDKRIGNDYFWHINKIQLIFTYIVLQQTMQSQSVPLESYRDFKESADRYIDACWKSGRRVEPIVITLMQECRTILEKPAVEKSDSQHILNLTIADAVRIAHSGNQQLINSLADSFKALNLSSLTSLQLSKVKATYELLNLLTSGEHRPRQRAEASSYFCLRVLAYFKQALVNQEEIDTGIYHAFNEELRNFTAHLKTEAPSLLASNNFVDVVNEAFLILESSADIPPQVIASLMPFEGVLYQRAKTAIRQKISRYIIAVLESGLAQPFSQYARSEYTSWKNLLEHIAPAKWRELEELLSLLENLESIELQMHIMKLRHESGHPTGEAMTKYCEDIERLFRSPLLEEWIGKDNLPSSFTYIKERFQNLRSAMHRRRAEGKKEAKVVSHIPDHLKAYADIVGITEEDFMGRQKIDGEIIENLKRKFRRAYLNTHPDRYMAELEKEFKEGKITKTQKDSEMHKYQELFKSANAAAEILKKYWNIDQ